MKTLPNKRQKNQFSEKLKRNGRNGKQKYIFPLIKQVTISIYPFGSTLFIVSSVISRLASQQNGEYKKRHSGSLHYF